MHRPQHVIDSLRYLGWREKMLSANVNTLRGLIRSLEVRHKETEKLVEELKEYRELDRAKLASLQSQMLNLGDSQLSIVTGGLRQSEPEPEEAIAVLAKHAGRRLSSDLIGKAIVSIPLLALGAIGLFFSLPEPITNAILPTSMEQIDRSGR